MTARVGASNHAIRPTGDLAADTVQGMADSVGELIGDLSALTEDVEDLTEEVQATTQYATVIATDRDTGANPTDLTIQTGAQKTLVLATPTYEDLRVPVNSVRLIPEGVRNPAWEIWATDYLLLAFSDQGSEPNEEEVHFVCQVPHSYKSGTPLYPHVHWVAQDNTAGNVRWKLTYLWGNIGGTFTGDTIYCNAANSATSNAHNICSFDPIAGTGKTISSMLICRLSRNSSDSADTYNSKKAYLLEFDFHYQQDTTGSRQETTK